jgi:hypothetical protein
MIMVVVANYAGRVFVCKRRKCLMYICVCNIMYVISPTTIQTQQKRQDTVDIHLSPRGHRTKPQSFGWWI